MAKGEQTVAPLRSPMMEAQTTAVPLCVDLDGTLIFTDLLWVSLVQQCKCRPWHLLFALACLWQGRARLKRRLAIPTALNLSVLPYNTHLLRFLRAEASRGRALYLVTGSDILLAEQVATYLPVFHEVIASDGRRNLTGKKKAAVLVARFGTGGFDYVGNSRSDFAVWAKARHAFVVNLTPRAYRRALRRFAVRGVFPGPELPQ